MSDGFGEPFDTMKNGQALTEEEADWDVIGELVGIEWKEYEEYEYYITEFAHPMVFIKGDVAVVGNGHTHDLPQGREGFDLEGAPWGVVVLGDLEVSGNLSLDELSPLFVTGNLKAGSVTDFFGSLVVSGTIEAPLIYRAIADEGGIVHASGCETLLFINEEEGNFIDSGVPGDYRELHTSTYPREKAALQSALEELGCDGIAELVGQGDPKRIEKLIERLDHYLDDKPEGVPQAAEWDDGYPSGFKLQETDDEGRPHGIYGNWDADGALKTMKRFKHGTPHGEWTVEISGLKTTLVFDDGEPQRPDSVPEAAVFRGPVLEPDSGTGSKGWWELSETDDDGKEHGTDGRWDHKGNVEYVKRYRHGEPHGEWTVKHRRKRRTLAYEDGELKRPESIPQDAVWNEDEWAWTLNETEDDEKPQGIDGQWEFDGTARYVERYKDGQPHGEWVVEENGRLHTLTYEDGELQRPESVPEEASWLDDESVWVLSETDDDGNPHGIEGRWDRYGSIEHVSRYRHGEPHGEWAFKHNDHVYFQVFESGERQRPEAVPEGAVWIDDELEWELSETDEEGEKHGVTKWWRPDGTFIGEGAYVHGVIHGEGNRYHESGELAEVYTFVEGRLHGERIFYATDEFTTERAFESQPDAITKMVYLYENGQVRSTKFYDRDDHPVNYLGDRI